jgi:hypothetical protein
MVSDMIFHSAIRKMGLGLALMGFVDLWVINNFGFIFICDIVCYDLVLTMIGLAFIFSFSTNVHNTTLQPGSKKLYIF